jgi:hypothetical protein
MLERCHMLDWAGSGAMALTGRAGGQPLMSPAPAFSMLGEITEQLARATRATGDEVRADPAEMIAGRAALMSLTRGGKTSAGGSSRLLRTADGWCAVTLSRHSDMAAVPAILGVLGLPAAARNAAKPDASWTALEEAALAVPAAAVADAAQLLGVPAAALPTGPDVDEGREAGSPGAAAAPQPPSRTTRLAGASPGARLAGAVVVDLSSMWAGPLCARLLGFAGARVIKVESPDRPDGARAGNDEFFDWLHAGHRSVAVDFRSGSGRAALVSLLRAADVVIEASRPRALANLGLDPATVTHKEGQVWLSITGYGRAEPDRVAFGDDAAAAGGLVGWTRDSASGDTGADTSRLAGRHEPVFLADAIADPLTGICGALAVAQSLAEGGGHLIDLSMRAVAAAFAAAPAPDHGPHEYRPHYHQSQHQCPREHRPEPCPDGTVTCLRQGLTQEVLPPRRPVPAGRAAELGADTEAVLAWLASWSC